MFQGKDENTASSSLAAKFRSFFAQEFFHNHLVQWITIPTLIINLGGWAALRLMLRTPLDLMVTLHYNVYFGVDVIGYGRQAYLVPGVATIFLLINLCLAYFFYGRKNRVAAYIFLLATLLIQAGTAIAVAGIILINY